MTTAAGKAKQYPLKVQWRRDNLAEWRDRRTSHRLEMDMEKMSDAFRLAARIPVLRAAIDWATQHDIEYVVDRMTRARGYYHSGTGVVAIALDTLMSRPHQMASTIVHEIRHAWQDYHGLIPTGGRSFSDYYVRVGLIEADAMAHGMLAKRQCELADNLRDAQHDLQMGDREAATRIDQLEKEQDDKTAQHEILRDEFRRWYDLIPEKNKSIAEIYGSAAMLEFGHAIGIPGITPEDYRHEYKPPPVPAREGGGITRYEDLLCLGKDFRGRHYFNKASREFIFRHALSPDHAGSFFSTRGGRDPLVDEMRRRTLSLTLREKQHVFINV
jgi:hypothetical protein